MLLKLVHYNYLHTAHDDFMSGLLMLGEKNALDLALILETLL